QGEADEVDEIVVEQQSEHQRCRAEFVNWRIRRRSGTATTQKGVRDSAPNEQNRPRQHKTEGQAGKNQKPLPQRHRKRPGLNKKSRQTLFELWKAQRVVSLGHILQSLVRNEPDSAPMLVFYAN